MNGKIFPSPTVTNSHRSHKFATRISSIVRSRMPLRGLIAQPRRYAAVRPHGLRVVCPCAAPSLNHISTVPVPGPGRRDHRSWPCAGSAWHDNGLVFASTVGTPLDRYNVRREFCNITEEAGLGRGWAPRELRHSFVSVLSANGVTIEEIARLAGHSTTRITELVYRKELRPVLTSGAEVMDAIFS